MKKRIISIILSLVMVVGLLPIVANAASTATVYVKLNGQPASPSDLGGGRTTFWLNAASILSLTESPKGTFKSSIQINRDYALWCEVNTVVSPFFYYAFIVTTAKPTLTVNCYTVTYNPGTGGIGSVQSDLAANGANFKFPGVTYTRQGYTQTGWASSDGGAKVYDLWSETTDISAKTDLYPVWTAALFPVTVNVKKDGDAWVAGAPTITFGTTSPTAVANGASVGNGTYNIYADGTDTGVDVTVNGSAASVDLNYYTVTYNPGTNVTGSQQTATKIGGAALTLKNAIFSKVGYDQTGWATSEGGTKAYDFGGSYTTAAAQSFYPVWTLKEATVPALTGSDPVAVTFGYTNAPSMKVFVTSPDTTNFNYTYAWYAGPTVTGTAIASATTDTYAAPTGLTAGNHPYTVKVTATNKADGSKTASSDKTFTVTVNKANGSGSVSMAGWTYGGTESEPVPTSNSNGTVSVTYKYKVINAPNDTETATKPTNAGDYTVTATFAGAANYNQCTATANFTISKEKVTLPTAVTGLVYNGTEQIGVASGDPALYTVLNGNATNAGSHTATAILVDNVNYAWDISTPSSTDQSIAWSIAKAPVTFVVTNNNVAYNAVSRSATVAQTEGEVQIPEGGYAVSYAQSSSAVASPTNKGSYNVIVTISDTNFKHLSTAAAASNVGTLIINETTYPQAASMTWPTAANLTYGQKLSDSTLSGGDQATNGSYTWKDGNALPTVSNSGYTVVFTPNDINYKTVEQTIPITVAKATPTLSLPTASAITYGQKLSVSALTGGSASITYNGVSGADVPGTFTWTVPHTMPSVSDSGSTDYALTFTPTDSLNYNVVTTGKIKLTVDQKEVGLTWSGYESLVYSDNPVNVTATATGLVGVDACTVTVTEGDKTDAGTHTVTATTLNNPNYKLPAVNTLSYTIAKAPVTFLVSGNSYTYDASNKTATVVQNATDALQMPANSFDVSYQQSGGNITPKDAGAFDVLVKINDDNFKFEGQAETTRTFKVGTLTIGKKSITALWKNLHHVYDGTTKYVTFAFTGVETDDKNQVNAQLSTESSKTNSGSYSVKAELTGTRSSNYTLTNPAGSLVIQKAL